MTKRPRRKDARTRDIDKKKKKKKRRSSNESDLYLLTGLSLPSSRTTAPEEQQTIQSLDDCLAAMQGKKEESTALSTTHTTLQLDAVAAWNASFVTWCSSSRSSLSIRGGKQQQQPQQQPTDFIPSLETELTRHFCVQELTDFVRRKVPALRMPSLERWFMDVRVEQRQQQGSDATDVLLCAAVTPEWAASRRLQAEIEQVWSSSSSCDETNTTTTRQNNSGDTAASIVRELCGKTRQAVSTIRAATQRCRGRRIGKKDRIVQTRKGVDVISLSFHRKGWKKPFQFRINQQHYRKLERCFAQVHGELWWNDQKGKFPTQCTFVFDWLVIVLLLRYSSLSGGHLLHALRGGGMQGAVHTQVFDVLQEYFDGPYTECFASPFNTCWPVFYSAFSTDLDWHFGSRGDFFQKGESRVLSGCFQANPPFSPGVMTQMSAQITRQLALAAEQDSELTFVVIVPTVSASPAGLVQQQARKSFRMLQKDPHCSLHVVLKARDHGYIEGAQHVRPTHYKVSQYNTSVFILESKKKKESRENRQRLDQLKASIQSAFLSLHEDELKQRQQQHHAPSPS